MARRIKRDEMCENEMISDIELGELGRFIADLKLSPLEIQELFLRILNGYLKKEIFRGDNKKYLN